MNSIKKLFQISVSTTTLRLRLNPACHYSTIQSKKISLKYTDAESLPDEPKPPTTAFIRFILEIRSTIEKSSFSSATEYNKKLAELWRTADENKKQILYKQFRIDMKRYYEDLAEYESKLTDVQKEVLHQRKQWRKRKLQLHREQKKQENMLNALEKPKRPKNAFFLFIDEQRKQLKVRTNLIMYYKDSWNKLSGDCKQKYAKEAEILKEQYLKDLEAWEMKMIECGNVELVRKSYRKKYELIR